MQLDRALKRNQRKLHNLLLTAAAESNSVARRLLVRSLRSSFRKHHFAVLRVLCRLGAGAEALAQPYFVLERGIRLLASDCGPGILLQRIEEALKMYARTVEEELNEALRADVSPSEREDLGSWLLNPYLSRGDRRQSALIPA
jgi:hypothetical protein